MRKYLIVLLILFTGMSFSQSLGSESGLKVKGLNLGQAGLSVKKVTATGTAGYTGYTPTANTVLYLPLNGNSNDSTGTYTQTDTDISYVTGHTDRAASFNGSTSFIDVTSSSGVGLTSGYTLSAWIYLNALGSYQEIISKASADGTTGYEIRVNSDNTVSMVAGISGTYRNATTTTTVTTGIWYLVTGTYDGTTLKIYLNATSENPGSYSGTISTNASNINIGRSPTQPTLLMNGYIDDPIIEDYAWTTKIVTYYDESK